MLNNMGLTCLFKFHFNYIMRINYGAFSKLVVNLNFCVFWQRQSQQNNVTKSIYKRLIILTGRDCSSYSSTFSLFHCQQLIRNNCTKVHILCAYIFFILGNPDTLICGNCRECFNELSELLDHKKSYCKLRFTCKCQDVAFAASKSYNSSRGAWGVGVVINL